MTSTEVAELAPATIARFAEMVTIVPDYAGGSASSMIDQILGATTAEGVDEIWLKDASRKLPTNKLLFVTGISKYLSEFSGGLPFYLVVECVNYQSGEVKEYTTGATMSVAQLVKWYSLDEFPIALTAVEVGLKDGSGNSAQHLEMDPEATAQIRERLAGTKAK